MLKGAYTALVTPFDEQGEPDFSALARLLAWHESEGMDGVVIAGTNGEGPSLSGYEKRDLVRFAVENAGRLRIIAGLGTCSLTEAIWLSREAKKAGAAASLVLPPFYFRAASETGICEWFNRLLDSCDLPCILYNFPKMTGFTFSTGVLDKLFARDGVVAIKDSSGDESLLGIFLASAASHEKEVFVGDETLIDCCLSKGGSGTISGLANSFPRLVSRACHEPTEAMHGMLRNACAAIKKHPQPAVHKFVLQEKGLPGGGLRPPLQPISEAARIDVKEFLSRFGY